MASVKLLLKESIKNVGRVGDIVEVSPGYARNYLLPRGLATVADKRNMRALEHERRIVDEKRKRALTAAEALAQQLAGAKIVIHARAGEEGKLFGSVTNIDVERALADLGHTVERRRIRLDEPIKTLGDYKVPVTLTTGVPCELTVTVAPIEE